MTRNARKIQALGHSAHATAGPEERPGGCQVPSRGVSAPEKWTAVVNPTAGRGRTRKLLPRINEECQRLGIQVEVPLDVEGTERAARAAFDRGHGVLACGGDGTVSLLASLASHAGAALGIVPTGAGNDFARHLGIDHRRPLDALQLPGVG